MNFNRKIVRTFLLSLGLLNAGVAGASVTINVTEVAGDVVFSATGSLNLSGATFLSSPISYFPGFITATNSWYVAPGSGRAVDIYALTSFAGAFGTSGSSFFGPTTTSGDNFFIFGDRGTNPQVGVTSGYLSGTAMTSGMVFSGATIANLFMTPGQYAYGINSDTITLNIGPPPITPTTPIPEPEIYALMGLGLGLLGWIGRRRKLAATA